MPEPEFITAEQIQEIDFSTIIDVRSPSEFADDHLPGAINLPVLNDAERIRVGTIYKQQSPFLARRLGAAIIARRVAEYLEGPLADKERDFAPLLYCWRGGMRSFSFATILSAVGWRTRLVEGGYKAYRKHITASLESHLNAHPFRFVIVSGLTGSGKTRILTKMQQLGHQVIDLEGLAEHRGSALGESTTSLQPSQKRFENLLWHTLRTLNPAQPIFLESESNRIGSIQIPSPLWKHMGHAPSIEITVPREVRARFLIDHYHHFLDDPELLKDKLTKLKHLHGTEQLNAWNEQISSRAWQAFTESILQTHYDPAYTRSRAKNLRHQLASIHGTDLSPPDIESLATAIAAATKSVHSWE